MRECYLCGATQWIERHHVFGGSRRRKSEEHGMVVDLCHWCHNEPPAGVHHNKKRRLILQQEFQRKFEQTQTRQTFMSIFGKSYL